MRNNTLPPRVLPTDDPKTARDKAIARTTVQLTRAYDTWQQNQTQYGVLSRRTINAAKRYARKAKYLTDLNNIELFPLQFDSARDIRKQA